MFGRCIKRGLVLTLFKKMRLEEDAISLNLGSCFLPICKRKKTYMQE